MFVNGCSFFPEDWSMNPLKRFSPLQSRMVHVNGSNKQREKEMAMVYSRENGGTLIFEPFTFK
jgi:hypothetical protein